MKERPDDNKQLQIKHLLEDFYSKYLDIELKSYSLALFETISKKSTTEYLSRKK